MIKFEELTLAEIEEIEQLLGKSLDEAFAESTPKGRALRVLVFVFKKREDPNFKFDDTAKLTQKEAVAYLSGDNPKAD